jgi:hypothetical protein
LIEIYEDKVASFSLKREGLKKYALREVYVNPEHVVLLRPNLSLEDKNSKVIMPEGLHPAQKYTIIYINKGQSGLEITAVGEPSAIEEKLALNNKKVLKG